MVEPRPIDNPKFAQGELGAARRYLDEHGWVVIRGVFAREEIAELRERVLISRRDGMRGDLLSNPLLSPVMTDPRIGRIVKALLPAEPVYFGDSGWNTATTDRIQMGFHKDNPDKEHANAPDWRSPYTIFTMGIYLQDSARYSGGVAVRDRSQNTLDAWHGRPVAVPAEVGDFVVWNYRTSHTGYASRLHVFPNAFVPINVQSRLTVSQPRSDVPLFRPRGVFRPAESAERMALFMAFGIDDAHVHRNIRYLKTRRYWVERLKHSTYADEARTRLAEQGIGLIDVADQVRTVDLASVPEAHFELPFDDDAAPPPGVTDRGRAITTTAP
ncbi:hypothetical protein BH11MYX4_BH11MYX4_00110 [soil metagenome]